MKSRDNPPCVDKEKQLEVLHPEDVAQFLRKSVSWVYKHWKELGGVKIGGSILFPDEETLYEHIYMAKRWVKEWGKISAREISQSMIEKFLFKRLRISAFTANVEIRYLKAAFNYGKKRGMIDQNPLDGISFFPIEKRIKKIPTVEDIDKIIAVADPDTQDYLWVIRETMGRISEINRLEWKDVNFEYKHVILYTRKKKGGHLTPRKIPMTEKLHEVLSARYANRDKAKPWVFWHEYISSKTGKRCCGPYKDRKRLMKRLCTLAGVEYFRYHAIRHCGASLMESINIPIGSIQRILDHENRNTTEIYLHSIGDSEVQAIKIYEGARQKSHRDSHTTKNGL